MHFPTGSYKHHHINKNRVQSISLRDLERRCVVLTNIQQLLTDVAVRHCRHLLELEIRVAAYENKIKELCTYDTGLTDWVLHRMQYGKVASML